MYIIDIIKIIKYIIKFIKSNCLISLNKSTNTYYG